jgi:hypothetical protein
MRSRRNLFKEEQEENIAKQTRPFMTLPGRCKSQI